MPSLFHTGPGGSWQKNEARLSANVLSSASVGPLPLRRSTVLTIPPDQHGVHTNAI
jgi:hypothetical protein